MKKLCAFIICAIISVYAGAHVVNTKNEVKETKSTIIQTSQTSEITTIEFENESEITDNKEVDNTTSPVLNTTTTKPPVQESVTNSNAAFYLTDYERSIVEKIVMGEAGGESYEGQLLVAFCIFNACIKDDIQPSQVKAKYKYAGWNNNPSESVKKAVSEIFDKGHKPTNESILYFYSTKYAEGTWHETQKFVCEVGDHRFFAEW